MNKELEKKLNKATSLQESGRINEAEVLYKDLLLEMPLNDLILAGLSLISIDKKKFNHATEYINKAIKIKQLPIYYITLGNIHHKRTNPEKSREFYQQALNLQPDNIQAMFNIGVSYLSEFNIDEGELYLNKVMDLDPNIAECYFQLAFTYSVRQEMDKAIQYLVKAIEVKPNYGEAMFLLSCI